MKVLDRENCESLFL
jgi:hypothetical protein